MDCDFYHLVQKEQDSKFQQGSDVLALICTPQELVQAYTQLESAYREMREIQAQLLQAQKLEVLGKVASGVAHDLNNPLTGILSYAEDLLDQLANNKSAREDVQFIIDQATQCRQIVRDLLDFSRKSTASRKPTSFGTVLEKAIKLVRKQPAFHNIQVSLMVDEDIPYVNFDPRQLQQVLLNLIINARDAMEGNGEITVFAQKMHGQGKIVVNIIDQGCGISPENVGSVFDAFYSTKGDEGHGIGLSTVRNIIEKNGGTISVTSNVGCGSCFRILLPIFPDKKFVLNRSERNRP
jgi:two-component system NtrC family sensor kinase